MYLDFSKLFHNSSKDPSAGGSIVFPKDQKDWPDAWKTTHYKEYPSFKKIPLSDLPPHKDLFETIRARKSSRDYSEKAISLDEISTLLKYSCGGIGEDDPTGSMHRAQASAGGLFPIEIYPLIFRDSGDLRSGLYHYNVRDHSLDVLWQRRFEKRDIAELFTYEWIRDASMAIVMTGVFGRNQIKYGERGYRYLLLEAGHIGQNIYLVSEALGLKCCGLGGTRDVNLEKCIDIDGATESVVYGLSIGK